MTDLETGKNAVHYLDNSATTPLSRAAKEMILQTMEVYGNPSSLHRAGQEAEKYLSQARAGLLSALGGPPPAGGRFPLHLLRQ